MEKNAGVVLLWFSIFVRGVVCFVFIWSNMNFIMYDVRKCTRNEIVLVCCPFYCEYCCPSHTHMINSKFYAFTCIADSIKKNTFVVFGVFICAALHGWLNQYYFRIWFVFICDDISIYYMYSRYNNIGNKLVPCNPILCTRYLNKYTISIHMC